MLSSYLHATLLNHGLLEDMRDAAEDIVVLPKGAWARGTFAVSLTDVSPSLILDLSNKIAISLVVPAWGLTYTPGCREKI